MDIDEKELVMDFLCNHELSDIAGKIFASGISSMDDLFFVTYSKLLQMGLDKEEIKKVLEAIGKIEKDSELDATDNNIFVDDAEIESSLEEVENSIQSQTPKAKNKTFYSLNKLTLNQLNSYQGAITIVIAILLVISLAFTYHLASIVYEMNDSIDSLRDDINSLEYDVENIDVCDIDSYDLHQIEYAVDDVQNSIDDLSYDINSIKDALGIKSYWW